MEPEKINAKLKKSVRDASCDIKQIIIPMLNKEFELYIVYCMLKTNATFLLIVLQVFASRCLSPSAKPSVDLLQCFQIFLDTPLWKTQIQFLQSSSVMNSAPRMPCTICAVLCIQFAVEVFGLIHVKVTVMVSLYSIDISC